jgi:hypothetical protein
MLSAKACMMSNPRRDRVRSRIHPCEKRKKPTRPDTLEVSNHVGLLFNEPPSDAGVLFV